MIYFDDDPYSENIGWVLRVSFAYSYDGFKTKEEAEKFLADNRNMIYQLFQS